MTERSDKRSDPSGPDQLLEIWRRRRWIGIAVATLAFAAAATASLSLPNLYRATATVIVERQQVSEEYIKASVTEELETRIQTIHQRVTSNARLAELIQRLHLYEDANGQAPIHRFARLVNADAILRMVGLRGGKPVAVPTEVLVERLRKDIELSLKGVEQTNGRRSTVAFSLGFSGGDPKTVSEVANTLAAFYVGENTKSRERQALRTAEFLKAQVGDAKRDLDERQRLMSSYKSRHDGELQPFEVNSTAIERLNTRLMTNAEAQARANERRQRLEEQIANFESGAPAVVGTTGDVPLAVQLAKARRELAELQKRYSDRYPEVIRKKGELAVLEQEVGGPSDGDGAAAPLPLPQTPSIRLARQSIGEVDRELRTLKSEEASIKQTIGAYEGRMEAGSRRQQEFQQLSRGYDTVQERYQALSKRADDAQAAELLEQERNTEQFRILDPATVPPLPSGPGRTWLLIVGLLAAIALGTAAIVIAEKMDATLRSVDDLRSLTRLPVLAQIRRIPTAARARDRHLRFVALTMATALGIAVVVSSAYYVTAGNEQLVRLMSRPGA
jgi:succinoglycan biosynthesis transport protein ExoP